MAARKRRVKAKASVFRARNGERYVKPTTRKCFLSNAAGGASATAMEERDFETGKAATMRTTRPQRPIALKTAVADTQRERERSPDRGNKRSESNYREREPLVRRSTRIQHAKAHTVKFETFGTAPRQSKSDFELEKEVHHSRLYESGPHNADFPSRESKVRAMQQRVIKESAEYEPEEEEEAWEPDFQVDMQQKYCICHSDADEDLVDCVDCGRSYHPHCIGKALQDLASYEDEHAAKSRALDAEKHRDTEAFTCVGCDGKHAAEQDGKKRKFT